MAVKRTPADQWFSKCVRIRTNWTCEYCNINYEHDKGYLHCSHYISRAHHITRYNPINAMAHCQRCHEQLGGGRWGGGNIAEFAHHYDEIHGPKNREKIRKISHYPFPKHKRHIKDISTHFRQEFARLEQLRLDGRIDRLEFEPYTGCIELLDLEERIC